MLLLCLQEAGWGPDESGGPTGVPVRTSKSPHAASQAVSFTSPLSYFSSALGAPFRTRRNLLSSASYKFTFLHAHIDDRQTWGGWRRKSIFVYHDFLLCSLSSCPQFFPPPPVVFVAPVSPPVALFLSIHHLLLPPIGKLAGSPVKWGSVTGGPVTGGPVTGSRVLQ